MKRCRCRPGCEAEVRSLVGKYARGHSPASRRSYKKRPVASAASYKARGKKISATIRRKQEDGTYEVTRQRLSVARKRLWKTEEYRQNRLKSEPGRRDKIGVSAEKRWQDPIYRARTQSSMVKAYPKGAEARSRGLKRKWKDPVYVAKVTKSRRAVYQSVGYKEKRSSLSTAMWQRVSYREAHASGMRRAAPSISLAQQKVWESVEYRKKHHSSSPKFKSGWYPGVDGPVWLRSGYEAAFAYWLDKNKIAWLYESRVFNLVKGPYKGHRYAPDFYLPAQGLWVEIKGWISPREKKKLKSFVLSYPNEPLLILSSSELKKFGLIPFRKSSQYGLSYDSAAKVYTTVRVTGLRVA